MLFLRSLALPISFRLIVIETAALCTKLCSHFLWIRLRNTIESFIHFKCYGSYNLWSKREMNNSFVLSMVYSAVNLLDEDLALLDRIDWDKIKLDGDILILIVDTNAEINLWWYSLRRKTTGSLTAYFLISCSFDPWTTFYGKILY